MLGVNPRTEPSASTPRAAAGWKLNRLRPVRFVQFTPQGPSCVMLEALAAKLNSEPLSQFSPLSGLPQPPLELTAPEVPAVGYAGNGRAMRSPPSILAHKSLRPASSPIRIVFDVPSTIVD